MVRHGRMGNAPGEDVTLTPPEIWERLERIGGGVYDPCPHPRPEGWDGLTAPWVIPTGQVGYANPPFSGLLAWSFKASVEHHTNYRSVVVLVPCRTSQPYWALLHRNACTVAYWTGDKDHGGKLPRRIRFLDKTGKRMPGAPFDAALFLMSSNEEHRARFAAAFQDVATIVRLKGA